MSKVNIKTLDSLSHNDSAATKLINDNFKALKEGIEESLSRTGKTPNFMDTELDMNSRRIINVGDPVDDTDVVSYGTYKKHIEIAVKAAEDSANSAKRAASSAAEARQDAKDAHNSKELAKQYADEAKDTVDTGKEELNTIISNGKTDLNEIIADGKEDLNSIISEGLMDIQDTVDDGKATLEETTATGEEILKKYLVDTYFNPFVLRNLTFSTEGWEPSTVYADQGYNYVKTLVYTSYLDMPSSNPWSASAFVTLSMKDATSGNVGPYATAFLTDTSTNKAAFGLSLYVKEMPTEPIIAESVSWFIKENPNGAV